VHPNDHVNMGQSTNDVFPTATRLALLSEKKALIESARALSAALDTKAASFEHVPKVGRTHLQDACRSRSDRSSAATRRRWRAAPTTSSGPRSSCSS
jgi:aspartate ammonia-lyase